MRFVLAMLLFFPLSSKSSDIFDYYAVVGLGASTCATFSEGMEANDEYLKKFHKALYLSWLYGYMTGVNRFAHNTYNISTADKTAYISVLNKYCQEHPLDKFSEAVSDLVIQLSPNAIPASPAAAHVPPNAIPYLKENDDGTFSRFIDEATGYPAYSLDESKPGFTPLEKPIPFKPKPKKTHPVNKSASDFLDN